MSQLSYLKQIAHRAKGDLPMLSPPRSPLMGMERSAQSSSTLRSQPLEMLDEIPSIAPLSNQFPVPPPSASTPIVEKSSTTQQDFSVEANLNQISSSLTESPISKAVTSVIPPSGQKLGSRGEDRTFKMNPPSASGHEVTVKIPSEQKLSEALTTEARPILAQVDSVPTVFQSHSKATNSNLLAQNPEQFMVLNQASYDIEVESPNRVDGTVVESFHPKQESLSENRVTQTAQLPSLTSQTDSPKGNTIHIGSIDVHIVPPPAVPPKVTPTVSKPTLTSSLSRGFTSSFGLRQG